MSKEIRFRPSKNFFYAITCRRRGWRSVKLVSDMAYGVVIAKFHYTNTYTAPTRTRTFFAAKRTRTDPTEFRRKKVRVRVVEFSYYCCVSDSAVSRCRMTDSEPACRSRRRSVGRSVTSC